MRTRRTTAGVSVAVLLALLGAWPAAAASGAQAGPRKAQAHALIAGTIFRETGLSLAGAEVTLTQAGDSQAKRKFRPMQAVSDARGEFAFRVPPQPAQYRLSVRAAGYLPEEKLVAVAGEERVDAFFRLRPASKN